MPTPEEDALYTKNLEELVKARTQQLQRAVAQNQQFLDLLKQIQSMESLEQVREAIGVVIRRLTSAETQAPRFGGKAG